SGPDTGGTPVTITGTGFTGATSATFGGVAGTSFVVVNDTTITVVTPPHAAGAVDVVVVHPVNGPSAPFAFTFVPGASIARLVDPGAGPVRLALTGIAIAQTLSAALLLILGGFVLVAVRVRRRRLSGVR
ncbi:MAG: IPT/TIG domain-containing protein, partial [Pseudolysinimonas sp.]